jgi:very-short-patch-repair endonuclease
LYCSVISLPTSIFEYQYGVAAQDQLLQAGTSSREIASAVRAGELERLGRRVLKSRSWLDRSPDESPQSVELWKQLIWAELLSCRPQLRSQAFAFRRTAAALWGLDGVPPGTVELAIVGGRPISPAFVRVRPILLHERACVDGFPVTSATRTLLDLGQVAGAEVLERALEAALRLGLTSVETLKTEIGNGIPRKGTASLKRLLETRPVGLPATESDAETLFLQLARRAGLPEPVRQFYVPTSEGRFRVDFAWPERRLAVEVDGGAAHASPEALTRDLRRQNRLLLVLAPAGWLLLRFSWADVAIPPFAQQTIGKLREAWALGVVL